MTRLLSSMNLLKSGYVSVNTDEIRIIDSNELLAQKLGGFQNMSEEDFVSAQSYEMPDFDENAPEDSAVDALFSENGMEGVQGSDGGDAAFGAGMDDDGAFAKAQAQAQEILEQARRQADEILEESRTQVKLEAENAYREAFENGQREGYQAGMQGAQQELERGRQELAQMESALKQKYEKLQDEMEPYLVRELSGIYEHLIGVELAQYKNVLMHLIDRTLHSTEAAQSYLVHVCPQDFPYISMQKAQLSEDGGLGNATLEVIEDQTLSKNECLIETENGIFDCSLSAQLEELKRKLMLLAYGGKGEKQQ